MKTLDVCFQIIMYYHVFTSIFSSYSADFIRSRVDLIRSSADFIRWSQAYTLFFQKCKCPVCFLISVFNYYRVDI